MKTKLFFSFLFVILIALISNFIFRSLMQNDFEDYVRGVREDRLYWVLASVEGSYEDGHWERALLIDSLHWGMMLGFDLRVSDNNGTEIIDSQGVLDSLEDNMRRRMESIIDVSAPTGDFEDYPLFVKGKEIGTLSVRGIRRRGKVAEKENVFIERGKEFLIISFIIAGGGAIFLALVFSTFLTNPVKRLKEATARLAKGDTGIKVDISSGDEIGELAESFNFMSEALKREDMIRRHLSSNIAHELRTPLTIMKANLEGIADGVIECSQEQIESLKEEVDRLISLVEGIEDITRAEASFL
ncbi:MAG TPA: HAMP domain-containing protein, partial [Nitrospirae bacterium]|nr:HAMP domain-containing protein [Nitrospirota bacterium]